MFEGKSIIQILFMGGFAMMVMFICSVVALAVILERLYYFRINSSVKRESFIAQFRDALLSNDENRLSIVCKMTQTPYARVILSALSLSDRNSRRMRNVMERKIREEYIGLEKNTGILGSIGSTIVYIGLFGTVIGIIRAFQEIAVTAGGGMGTVITGIAEALISTAAGICIAVPAVIAYNLLQKKIEIFVADMELCASEVLDIIRR